MRVNPQSQEESDIKSLWAVIADREARLLKLVEASVQIVWVVDKDGKVVSDVDPPQGIAHLTWSNFTGLSQESLRGRGWAAALHPDDLRTVGDVTRHARESGSAIECEFRVRHKSGEWRWMVCRGIPVRATNGDVIGWIGSCADIDAAKKTQEDLREAQQRLLAALEAGQMSTWIWRLDDNTFWWDPTGEVLWGLPSGERSHRIEDLLVLVHPDDRAAVQRASEETVATGEARGVEFRTQRADGKLQWLSSRGRVEKDEYGKPYRVVGAFVDITKLKIAEETIRHAQKMQALGTLAGGIAHDFNNLLLAIAGNARLALADLEPGHRARVSLDEIFKASSRATDLVRRILSFSTRAPREAAATQLAAGVQEALNLVRLSVPQSIAVRTHFDVAPLTVALDATELQQVVINLVTNAAYAIGDANGSIDVTIAALGDMARLEVKDTGCGMDGATLTRVFDPFFTTKPAGQGTGLGLAVVHGIVQSVQGSIHIDSVPGVGTTFTVLLPTAQDASLRQEVSQPIAYAGNGERILYVDDDEAVVYLIERALRQLGYLVSGYIDGAAAIRDFAARTDEFDIVITDLSMPGLNGFDIARAIRQVNGSIPIILTSGYVRTQDREQADALGIEHVIPKPSTIDELGQILDGVCKRLRSAN